MLHILIIVAEPDHIDVLISTRGEFVYDVALPVLLQRPVKLNISYVSQDRRSFSAGRLTTTEYNDTRSILYREVDTGQLPFERYFVRISIVAEFGNRRVEGSPFTSSELIGKKVIGTRYANINFLLMSMGSVYGNSPILLYY